MSKIISTLQIRPPVVLAVDDQEANIRLVGTVLSQAGYDVIPAFNGEQALRRIQTRVPDLILLDMRMPGMDGFELAERLRKEPRTANVPIIFLTAANEREVLVKAFAKGAVDYITKPFVAEELIARVHAHVELKLARDHLERLVREREEIAALVAHDLKNPLSSIRFSAQLLQRGNGASSEANAERTDSLVGLIQDAATHGLKQIQRYLEKRADIELRRRMNIVPVPLHDALLFACKRFRIQAEARGMPFECENFTDVSIMADPEALGQVLDNLVSNALKYSPAGSPVTVLMGSGSTGHARMAVMDRGDGVSADKQKQLFRRFVRLNADQPPSESTGLGLALAKQDVDQMGGSMWYEDRPGGGAAFILELPLADIEPAESAPSAMPAP